MKSKSEVEKERKRIELIIKGLESGLCLNTKEEIEKIRADIKGRLGGILWVLEKD